MKTLTKDFYARHALKVAPDLLGKVLCRRYQGVLTSGRIIEVEAYLGSEDPASHAYRGMTNRNRRMFGPAGFAYVYFTYGNHYCMNVVTGKEGKASAVLIRSLIPMEGIDVMKERRKRNREKELTSGPGKLTEAFAIGRGDNGTDLTGEKIWICDDGQRKRSWSTTERIGITRGESLPYRFVTRA